MTGYSQWDEYSLDRLHLIGSPGTLELSSPTWGGTRVTFVRIGFAEYGSQWSSECDQLEVDSPGTAENDSRVTKRLPVLPVTCA